jgi:hypothetical protein
LVKAVDILNISETETQNIFLSSYEESVAPKLTVDHDDYDDDHVSILYGPRIVFKLRQICLLLKLPSVFSEKNSIIGRLRLKCDVTRAETTFRLSAKRMSQFKNGGGVNSVDYWQPRIAHQR